MFTTAWTSGAAGSLWYILPVIVLVALLVIILAPINSGRQSTSFEGRRSFLGALVGIAVGAILIARIAPQILETMFAPFESEVLTISAGTTHTADDGVYDRIVWESTGQLTLADGDRLTVRESPTP